MEKEIIEGKRKIAEFMGREYNTMSDGKGGMLMGRLSIEWFKYDASWDWQVPAFSKAAKALKEAIFLGDDLDTRNYLRLMDKYTNAVFNNRPEDGFSVLIEIITKLKAYKS